MATEIVAPTGGKRIDTAQLTRELTAVGVIVRTVPVPHTGGTASAMTLRDGGATLIVGVESGDPDIVAAVVASHVAPPEPSETEIAARDTAATAQGRTPIERAVLKLAEMLERALAETRERCNAIAARCGFDDLTPLLNYPSFQAAVAAWQASLLEVSP